MPDCNVHKPVPTVGVFPANIAVVTLHKVWSTLAAAAVGLSATLIITSLVSSGQVPLEIVQRNVDEPPIVNAVTPEVSESGVVIKAEPDTTDQFPVPVPGIFPAKVVEVTAHKF